MLLCNYRPQRSWGKVIFSEACVHILSTGGACMVAPGRRGACVVARGVCMVVAQGHAWLLWGGHVWLLGGGMCGCSRGGMHGCSGGVHVVALGKGACVVAPGGVACVGYDEIRSMSGRYTSYWNVFLLSLCGQSGKSSFAMH